MQRARFLLIAIALATTGCSMTPAPAAISAEPGVAFTLEVGQSATFADALRVVLIEVDATGKCPPPYNECIAVSPPQARVRLEAPQLKPVEVVFLLAGTKSPEQAAAARKLRVVGVTPSPFSEDDVAQRRVTLTLLVARAEPEQQ